ncbi:hypothetical protein NDU88_007182 [Pleurodeles waltl]|uniref:Uncharacterized protein n=1 Tax=Pleurodeles waltl TaxID=8319 RepID=A0AAV7MEG8_PLEWA|nr:hypothetical protein NDU88_007182 [Pleurodeles waltl]
MRGERRHGGSDKENLHKALPNWAQSQDTAIGRLADVLRQQRRHTALPSVVLQNWQEDIPGFKINQSSQGTKTLEWEKKKHARKRNRRARRNPSTKQQERESGTREEKDYASDLRRPRRCALKSGRCHWRTLESPPQLRVAA